MKTMRNFFEKKFILFGIVAVLGTNTSLMHAQNRTYADKWAEERTQYYIENLGLSEQQAKEVHEVLLTTAKENEEIKKGSGDEQSKNQAIWQNNNEREKRLLSIFTPEQRKKYKDLQQPSPNAEKTNRENWAKERVKYYTENLGLSEKQAKECYDILLSTSEKAAEIKKNLSGEEQKKALWRNNKEREEMLLKILDEEQKKKFKNLK